MQTTLGVNGLGTPIPRHGEPALLPRRYVVALEAAVVEKL